MTISKEAEADDILCAMQNLIIDSLDSYTEEELRNMSGFFNIADLFDSIQFALVGDFTNEPVTGKWQNVDIDGVLHQGNHMAARWGHVSQTPGMTRELATALTTCANHTDEMSSDRNKKNRLPENLVTRLKQLGAQLKATGEFSYIQVYIRELT